MAEPEFQPEAIQAEPTDQVPFNWLSGFYQGVDATIAQFQPRCDVSGRCCRFDEFEHTLFLSRPEAELLFSVPGTQPLNEGRCPYQIDNQCTARERRPLGCRTYFCDPDYSDQMPTVSEQLIRDLKQEHQARNQAWDYRPLHAHAASLYHHTTAHPSIEFSTLTRRAKTDPMLPIL